MGMFEPDVVELPQPGEETPLTVQIDTAAARARDTGLVPGWAAVERSSPDARSLRQASDGLHQRVAVDVADTADGGFNGAWSGSVDDECALNMPQVWHGCEALRRWRR